MGSDGDKDKDKKEEQPAADDKAKEGLSPQQHKQVLIYLAQQNETLRRELAAQRERLEKITPPEPNRKQHKEEEPDESSLETMSRAQFAGFILKNVEDKVAKPILERMVESETGSERVKAEAELKDVMSKNPDFWDFKDETKSILEKYPQLTVGEALILARSNSPDKVKAIEAQKAEKEGKDKVTELKKRREAFGGLFPTSGKTAEARKMSAKDAAESAWESTGMGEHLSAIGE